MISFHHLQTDPENAFSNSTDVIFYQSCATSFVHETSLKATSPNSAICTDEQQTSINNVETRKFEPPSPASVSFQSPTLLEDGDSICNQEVSQYESVVFEDVMSIWFLCVCICFTFLFLLDCITKDYQPTYWCPVLSMQCHNNRCWWFPVASFQFKCKCERHVDSANSRCSKYWPEQYWTIQGVFICTVFI